MEHIGALPTIKLVGYARASTRQQPTDRKQPDIVNAPVRQADLYIDHGVSKVRVSRPQFHRARDMSIAGDTVVMRTLDPARSIGPKCVCPSRTNSAA